tara:strand:- start:2139 stop:2414 length:276 start_codon:yes stop_codon:yes gene_type:complete
MSINFTEFSGFLAAILTTLAFIPQVIKTYKIKKAEDISFYMLIIFLIGIISWIIYGLRINSYPILLANIITFTLNFSILVMKIIYKNGSYN